MMSEKLRLLATSALLLCAVLVGCSNAKNDSSLAMGDSIDVATTPNPSTVETSGNYYEITTRLGRMVIHLYDETPGHRDNFARLVDEGLYDSTSFHRVIANFMIQGGDPNSKNDDPMDDGQGGPGYTLPAEMNGRFFHKQGAIAAARQGDQVNPTRASSGSQFYIVLGGVPFDSTTLAQIERSLRTQIPDPSFAFSDSARAAYMQNGGAPHLDGSYTIFGEVVEGFDVLAAIGAAPTARATGQAVHPALTDQPFEKIIMQIRRLDRYSPSDQ